MIDLGYGSTMMYLGGPVMERAPLYISTTGDLVPVQRHLLLALSYPDSPDGTTITVSIT